MSVTWMSMALVVMVTVSVMTMIIVILAVSVSCNGDRGGVGGGRANKGDDKGRNGAHRSENRQGNGIAVELNSDHELVATEDYSVETVTHFLCQYILLSKRGLVLNGSLDLLYCKIVFLEL